jgi:hypothetical protein
MPAERCLRPGSPAARETVVRPITTEHRCLRGNLTGEALVSGTPLTMGAAPLAPGSQRLAGPHGDRAVIAVWAKIRPAETIPAVEAQRFDNAWPRGPPSSALMADPRQREVMVRSRNTACAERFRTGSVAVGPDSERLQSLWRNGILPSTWLLADKNRQRRQKSRAA